MVLLIIIMIFIISTLSMIILNIAGEPSPRLSSLCRNTMAMPARSLYRSYISSITNHHRQKSFKVTLAQKRCPKHWQAWRWCWFSVSRLLFSPTELPSCSPWSSLLPAQWLGSYWAIDHYIITMIMAITLKYSRSAKYDISLMVFIINITIILLTPHLWYFRSGQKKIFHAKFQRLQAGDQKSENSSSNFETWKSLFWIGKSWSETWKSGF